MQTNATLLANNSQHCWMLHVVSVCTSFCMLLGVVGSCCVRLFVAMSRGGHLGLIVIYLFKAYARNTTTEVPSTSIRFCLKTEIFSSSLAYRRGGGGAHPPPPTPRSAPATVSTYPLKTVTENASFQKRSPE